MSKPTIDRIMRALALKRPMTEAQMRFARREIARLVDELLRQAEASTPGA